MTALTLAAATALLAFAQLSHASVIVNVPEIIGKSQEQVASILNAPTRCSKSKQGETCTYPTGDTEIVYINGKADWITVSAMAKVPFNQDALAQLGLTPSKPTFSNKFTMRWSNVSGINEISLFKGAENTDYAYIKAFTK